ncbi:hypothetical protein RIF29_00197 [Crotalaria pallida]|uniref:MIF4G domain-containing protein n=1 Tax=Crotalaria pallida TaxID=3830 RepID=A0AAN9P6W8_CROPI
MRCENYAASWRVTINWLGFPVSLLIWGEMDYFVYNSDAIALDGEWKLYNIVLEAVARLEEVKKSIETKMALRQSNLNPERPDTGFFRTLDSSIKRNTAVIKKLKQINEEQREALMDELRGVNLSKFVSEAVTSICDAKLRSSDIQAAVQICSLLHQRYKDIAPTLIQGLLKTFSPGKPGDESDADRNLKAMKKRSSLKLLL